MRRFFFVFWLWVDYLGTILLDRYRICIRVGFYSPKCMAKLELEELVLLQNCHRCIQSLLKPAQNMLLLTNSFEVCHRTVIVGWYFIKQTLYWVLRPGFKNGALIPTTSLLDTFEKCLKISLIPTISPTHSSYPLSCNPCCKLKQNISKTATPKIQKTYEIVSVAISCPSLANCCIIW